ncbi:MAG: hypothetical protein ACD_81C00141G0001 [uncultured bacterium]|uniref:Branched-chain amino acid transport system,substrate-binding protein n=2 Tax=Candidatus Wolfeibacteriota TaxID=1752735 RepID=A0A0G1K5X4_9BACT|nr:MAG: hypothetical protein ACD_81C00141G0001 [uncultured bacterium]KKR12321.1 MAG: Branched-chain amino acid transport system,substrate-binding protein [Candidatus Wolfebacteria bacterium GW2011_GWC2_39_22]KKT43229.1 MAG: Branched-chain amino acid transport system,substrate-binding protein [Candidatus Wolfebacteria bacterium GW2011_GWE2_44_13]HBI25951.1 hypothetical protein [Candidatus Wolfebacteria bacterium]
MNKKITLLIVALLLAGVIAGAVFYKNSSPKDSVKVGFVAFPTGAFSSLGEIQLNAAKMAVADINNEGGINGRPLELIVEDYAWDPKRAIPAYEALKLRSIKFFDIEGAPASGILPPIIVKDGNFTMNSNTVLPSYTDGSPLTCRISLKAEDYAVAISNYLLAQVENPRIAFLAVNNDYGVSMKKSIEAILKQQGGTIVSTELFEQSVTDFRSQATRLKELQNQIDFLVAINASNSTEPMLKQIAQLKFSKPIVSDNWTVENAQIKTRSLVNAIAYAGYTWAATPTTSDSAEAAAFKKRFTETYNQPASPVVANTYDGIRLLAVGLANAPEQTPESVSNYLINTLHTYNGIGGTITFNNDCEAERSLVMRIIKDGQPIEIK